MAQSTNDRDNNDSSKKQEMVILILDVGDLAPIPKTAIVKLVKTEGNMFTRSFRLVFNADAKTIQKWLNDSPGVRTARVVKTGTNSK
jgi:hypothetical protein